MMQECKNLYKKCILLYKKYVFNSSENECNFLIAISILLYPFYAFLLNYFLGDIKFSTFTIINKCEWNFQECSWDYYGIHKVALNDRAGLDYILASIELHFLVFIAIFLITVIVSLIIICSISLYLFILFLYKKIKNNPQFHNFFPIFMELISCLFIIYLFYDIKVFKIDNKYCSFRELSISMLLINSALLLAFFYLTGYYFVTFSINLLNISINLMGKVKKLASEVMQNLKD